MTTKEQRETILEDAEEIDAFLRAERLTKSYPLVGSHVKALLADIDELERQYAELKAATWDVPGEPPARDHDDMSHKLTLAQAVDQSKAFDDNERLRQLLTAKDAALAVFADGSNWNGFGSVFQWCNPGKLLHPDPITFAQRERDRTESEGQKRCSKMLGDERCLNTGVHTVHGSLTYHACDEHVEEIRAMVDSES